MFRCYLIQKKVREKSWECHNHKPQPFPDTKQVNRLFKQGEQINGYMYLMFVCVEVLRSSQPNGVMSSAVSLPNHTFTGQT